MKKIALATLLVTSASIASAQLTFEAGPVSDAQGCDYNAGAGPGSPQDLCDTAAENFGQAAYTAYIDQLDAAGDEASAQATADDAGLTLTNLQALTQGFVNAKDAAQDASDAAAAA